MSKPNSARTDAGDDVAELRRRLDMAEDELTFLKAVFEEYKDSSGELEAELDAQLKDLERSNLALKRENEQIRAQLQSTVTRSRKSAEEASNLTTALEAHLEELTKREKKAQSRIRQLEQDNENLKSDTNKVASPVPGSGDTVGAEELARANAELEKLRSERAAQNTVISEIKENIYDARVKMVKLNVLAESRFSTETQAHDIPSLPADEADDLKSISDDVAGLLSELEKAQVFMEESGMSSEVVTEVSAMLEDHSKAHGAKLDGQSEVAINRSCILILGKIMVLGESLPEFKRAVGSIKTTLSEALADEATDKAAMSRLAHTVLMLCQDIMVSVFDPMETKKAKEDELATLKSESIAKIEAARAEGERLAKLEAEKRVQQIAAEQSTTASSLEEARKEMEKLKAESESQLQSARTEAKQLAEKARREALEEASVERKAIEEEVYQSVASEMDQLREQLESSEAQYKQAAMKNQMYQQSMKNAILDQSKTMMSAMKAARDELEILKRSAQSELAETQANLNENLNHVRKVARTIAKSDIATLSMMYERELDLRVKLQDQVQSLRGNIRVFCRIRPLLGPELEEGEVEAIKADTEMTVVAEDPENTGKPLHFNFDRVFGPADAQEVVFDEMRTLCLSALDGYNVCIFAYGITGSGKTFTVEGGEGARDNPKMHGLVYRTLKELFRIAKGERLGAYDTDIGVQLLELYNEDFRDLLVDADSKAPRPEVRLIPNVGVQIDNVTVHPVDKLSEALDRVKQGYVNRSTRSTSSNSLSSRSHSILTVHLKGTNVKTKKEYKGKLHFVDLAGSERVGKSNVTGDALKEAQAINKSLSALGDVIQALSQKEKFVPYRNSQLTKLLQESLGGNSKTVMISNISPCLHSMSETVASLRFATRAHKVEMGKAQQAVSDGSEAADKKEVKNIKNKMADLESKFKSRDARGRTTSASGHMKAPSTPRGRKSDVTKERSPRRPGAAK